MLTKCVGAVEQWLMKAKTFCGKEIFIKELFVACSSWPIEANSSSRRTHGFACHWWDGKPEAVLLLFLAWYHHIYVKNNRSNRRGLLRKTLSHATLRDEKEYLTSWHFFLTWNSFFPASPLQGDEGKCFQHDCSLLMISVDFLLD